MKHSAKATWTRAENILYDALRREQREHESVDSRFCRAEDLKQHRSGEWPTSAERPQGCRACSAWVRIEDKINDALLEGDALTVAFARIDEIDGLLARAAELVHEVGAPPAVQPLLRFMRKLRKARKALRAARMAVQEGA